MPRAAHRRTCWASGSTSPRRSSGSPTAGSPSRRRGGGGRRSSCSAPPRRRRAPRGRGGGGRGVASVATSMTKPTELFAASSDGSGERQLTHFNDKLNGEIAWSDAERFTYKSKPE